MSPYRVLVVDDHPLARQAVRTMLEDEPSFVIVGEASGGLQAIEACEQMNPDVVLMDIQMTGMSGLEATRQIKQRYPHMKIVILSVSDTAQDLFTAIRFGAQGYLLKSMDPSDWLDYLMALLEEQADLPSRITDRLFTRFRYGETPPKAPRTELEPWIEPLTPRENELLSHVAAGATNRQIAETFDISEHTVKNHMKNMLDKLGLENRVQLAAYAIRKGTIRSG